LFYCSQASKNKQFGSLHHWLLFDTYDDDLSSNPDGDGLVLSEDPLSTALEQLDLPLDSHVTVARPGPNRFLLQDVYRLVKGQPLIVTSPRGWSPGKDWPQGPRRDNYGGVQIKTVVIVSTIFISFNWCHFETHGAGRQRYLYIIHINRDQWNMFIINN
jgi:hypothetical protein